MWNDKTTKAATKDNCDCAGGAGVATLPGVVNPAANPVSVEKSATEANSKQTAATSFGGRNSEKQQQQQSSSDAAAINTQKEFAAQSETSDSGFISGPQSTPIFSGELSDDEQEQQQQQEQHHSLDKPQEKQQQQQVDKKIETIVSDSGYLTGEIVVAVEDTTLESAADAEADEAEQMRRKPNVDSALPQCTASLDLTGNNTATNNLNSATATTSAKTTTATARKSATQTTTGTTNATLNSSSNINIMNAWEQFYQQNDDGDTPLHLACISGFVDVVAALIRMAPHPCLLNIQNDMAQTPLHLAALTAQPAIIRMLLLAGAEPTIRNRHGNTALHLSCIAGEKQCVRALTEKFGASEIHEAHRQYGHRSNDRAVSSLSYAHLPAGLEIRNYDGERCVHLAAEGGHVDILRVLVSHGADINAREGKGGRTPLHIAIECCNEELANFLLDECEKINLETATYAGLTPYQVASVLNKSRMQNILKNRGAEPLTPPDSDYDSTDDEDFDDTKLYDRFGDPRYFVSYSGGNPMTVA